MGRIAFESLSREQQRNATEIVARVNALLADLAYTGSVRITSGYRSATHNASVAGAAKGSLHMQCAAVDIADGDHKLWQTLLNRLDLCKQHGLWLEDKRWTPTWVHLQIYPPKSGRRIFVPSTASPRAPTAFDGKYDRKFD